MAPALLWAEHLLSLLPGAGTDYSVLAQQVWEGTDPQVLPLPGRHAASRLHTPYHPLDGLTAVVSEPHPGSSVLRDTPCPAPIYLLMA